MEYVELKLVSQMIMSVCSRSNKSNCWGNWNGFYIYKDGSIDAGQFLLIETYSDKQNNRHKFYSECPKRIREFLFKQMAPVNELIGKEVQVKA